jgi:hypothetical protein
MIISRLVEVTHSSLGETPGTAGGRGSLFLLLGSLDLRHLRRLVVSTFGYFGARQSRSSAFRSRPNLKSDI